MRQRFQIKAKQSQSISHATSIRVTGELPDDSISIKSTRVLNLNSLKKCVKSIEDFIRFRGGTCPVQVCCTQVSRLLASADVHGDVRPDFIIQFSRSIQPVAELIISLKE
jgi:hypothetical protein